MTLSRVLMPLLLIGAPLLMIGGAGFAAAEHASFSKEILPILSKNCSECHVPGNEGYEKSGLDLSSYEGVMKGTKFGPVVVPGDSFSSNLSVLIEGQADPRIKMPHLRHEMTKWEKHMIRAWINKGAANN